MKIIMMYRLFLRRFFGDIGWNLVNLIILSILVFSFITILPMSSAIQSQLEQINRASNTLIEVRPKKNYISILTLDLDPFLVESINEDYESGLFFTSSDIERLAQVPHVRKVIGGTIIYLEIFWGYGKCFDNPTKEFILDFYLKQLEANYGVPREEFLQQLIKTASEHNISVYDYVYELAKGYFVSKNEILVINTSETIDIISYFNNLLEGEDIIDKHRDILLTLDALEILYINESVGKVITCDKGVEIGDEGEILFRDFFHMYGKKFNINVRLRGILPSNYLIVGVMDIELYNEIINNITSVLPPNLAENLTNALPLYSVAYVVVDDPSNINNVTRIIKSRFPDAQVIPISEAYQISTAAIRNLENSLNSMTILVNAIILISLLGLRVLEASKKKRELGLVKSFGWNSRIVFTYFSLPILIIGLFASIISTILYWLISPTITNILLDEFRRSIPTVLYIKLVSLLKHNISQISLYQVFGYALVVGILASLILTLVPLLYYNRLELEDVLREE